MSTYVNLSSVGYRNLLVKAGKKWYIEYKCYHFLVVDYEYIRGGTQYEF